MIEHVLLFRRNIDRIFTLTYKEIRIEHLLLGARKWDGTFTVRYKEL